MDKPLNAMNDMSASRPPSLPGFESGAILSIPAIKERLERHARSLHGELDKVEALKAKFLSKSSDPAVVDECRKYLEGYRDEQILDEIKKKLVEQSLQLSMISRTTSGIYKAQQQGVGRADSADIVEHAPGPGFDIDAVRLMLGDAVKASIEPLASMIAEFGASLAERPVVIAAPPAVPSSDPLPVSETPEPVVDPDLLGEEAVVKPTQKERGVQDHVFGRNHKDFARASRIAVIYVTENRTPLSPGEITRYLQNEGGVPSFRVNGKSVGNRLLNMGFNRVKRISTGVTGFWPRNLAVPPEWTLGQGEV